MIHLKDNSEQDTIDMIRQLVEWYNDYSSETTIELLLDCQDKLSILSVNLAYMTGKSKGNYIRAYFNRKVTHSIKKIAFISDGAKIGLAEEKALSQIGGLKEIEMAEEEKSYCLNLELRQLNKVLGAIQQRISFAKSEKQRMESLSHDNKNINKQN